jgi:hypothetical protein
MEGPRVEPDLVTDASLLDVLAELRQREPIFHRREHLSSREDFERQTAADFWEVGASGRRYSREFVWSVLGARLARGEDDEYASGGWQATEFQLRRIARDTYLLTYTLRQGDRLTRRLTVWQGSARAGWKILFHQGTAAS